MENEREEYLEGEDIILSSMNTSVVSQIAYRPTELPSNKKRNLQQINPFDNITSGRLTQNSDDLDDFRGRHVRDKVDKKVDIENLPGIWNSKYFVLPGKKEAKYYFLKLLLNYHIALILNDTQSFQEIYLLRILKSKYFTY